MQRASGDETAQYLGPVDIDSSSLFYDQHHHEPGYRDSVQSSDSGSTASQMAQVVAAAAVAGYPYNYYETPFSSNQSGAAGAAGGIGEPGLTLTPLGNATENNQEDIPQGNSVTELEPVVNSNIQCSYYVPNNEPSILSPYGGLRSGSPPLIGLPTPFNSGTQSQGQAVSNAFVAAQLQTSNGPSNENTVAAQSSGNLIIRGQLIFTRMGGAVLIILMGDEIFSIIGGSLTK